MYGYDNQGRALLNIGSNAEETTAKLNELIETSQRAANQTYIDNLDKVADGIYQNVKTSQDKIIILQQQFYTEKMALHTPQKSTRKAILCV